MKAVKKTTKKDFDKAVDEFCKFSKVVFAGSDENRKLQLLDGMKSLMNPKASVKRPIEVADNDSEAKRLKLTAFELPNEMWLQILSYLKNRDIYGAVALVSKRFHSFTIDPSIMKFLHIEIASNKWKSINLYRKCMKVVKRSTTLSELKITDESEFLDWKDLKLISNLPKLKSLTLNANHLKHINHMNFANLLLEGGISIDDYDDIMKELSKLPFPTLKTISLSAGIKNPQFYRRLMRHYEALKEEAIEKLVMNIPNLTCFHLDSSLKSGISHEFILRIFTEKDVVLLLDTYLTFDSGDQKTLEKFIEEKAGFLLLEKYRRIKNDFVQWRLKVEEIHPVDRKIKV